MDDNHKLKLKLGRRASYLRKCIRVHKLLQEYDRPECVRIQIFNKYIRPQEPMSYVTFNNILNESNPVKQLEQIEEELSTLN